METLGHVKKLHFNFLLAGHWHARGVYLHQIFFSKDSINGYLYLRGPCNRGVLIIPRVQYAMYQGRTNHISENEVRILFTIFTAHAR